MEIIHLPRMRNQQLQTLAEESIRICQPLTEVQPALFKVKTNLDIFKSGMVKEQVSAAEKKGLDKVRDHLVSGLVHDVRAEAYFPHDQEKSETVNQALTVINKYGASIAKLPQKEETAAIDNLLYEMAQLDQIVLKESAIARWIPLVKDANENFKRASGEFIDEKVDAAQIASASKQSVKLIEALEDLYVMLFAHVKVSDNEAIRLSYTKIENLVKSMN